MNQPRSVAAALSDGSISEYLDLSLIARTLTEVDNEVLERRDRNATRVDDVLGRLHVERQRLRRLIDVDADVEGPVLAALERQDYDALTKLGIDTTYAWMDEVVASLLDGDITVQIESVSPYAASVVDDNGNLDVRWDNLPAEEKAGIVVASMIRNVFRSCPNLRMAALLDDFHTDSPTRAPFTPQEQDYYIVKMAEILYARGVLLPGDVPGRDYLLTRERDLHALVDVLLDRLQLGARGGIDVQNNGDVVFRPSLGLIRRLALDSENRKREFARSGILVLRNGQPTCAALDAAGFMRTPVAHCTHLVILDKKMTSQQDKTYALVRAAGVMTQDRYENVFYDSERLSPQLIAYALCCVLVGSVERHRRVVRSQRVRDAHVPSDDVPVERAC